jgi:hypothetical protein
VTDQNDTPADLHARKKRVEVPGAAGWLLQGGRYRVLRYTAAGAHPTGWWFVQELHQGEWWAHDGDYLTMTEAIDYCEVD